MRGLNDVSLKNVGIILLLALLVSNRALSVVGRDLHVIATVCHIAMPVNLKKNLLKKTKRL